MCCPYYRTTKAVKDMLLGVIAGSVLGSVAGLALPASQKDSRSPREVGCWDISVLRLENC